MECHVYSDVDDVFQGSPPVPDRCDAVISRDVEVEVLVVRCQGCYWCKSSWDT